MSTVGYRHNAGMERGETAVRHRERVLLALNHEAPDRCPMQISFTPEFAARLRADMGLENFWAMVHAIAETRDPSCCR